MPPELLAIEIALLPACTAAFTAAAFAVAACAAKILAADRVHCGYKVTFAVNG